MATRGRKKAAEKQNKDALLEALLFVSLAQKHLGTHSQTHCIIRSGWCVASDNVLTIGAKVTEDLGACPQTERLIKALSRCTDTVSFTLLDSDRLSVKSGVMRVAVPCLPIESVNVTWADPIAAPLGAEFLDGCRAIGHLAADGGVAVHLASLLCRGGYMAATTGRVLAEFYHGFNTPPYWVLPKPAVNALLKVNKELVGLGYSGRSATFHFADESWIKTQLFVDKWPNGDSLFEQTQKTRTAVPETMFAAIDVLSEFAKLGAHVRFIDNKIELVQLEAEHAEYEVPGLQSDRVRFAIKDLQSIAKMAKTLDYRSEDRGAIFTGDRLRGLISLVHDVKVSMDDDIPF